MKTNAANAAQSEYDAYYSTDRPVDDLIAFRMNWASSLSREDAGRLIVAFNKRFNFYSLFAQYHIANDRREHYILYAIRAYSDIRTGPNDRRLTREDEASMREFIRGFAACIEALPPRRKIRRS